MTARKLLPQLRSALRESRRSHKKAVLRRRCKGKR